MCRCDVHDMWSVSGPTATSHDGALDQKKQLPLPEVGTFQGVVGSRKSGIAQLFSLYRHFAFSQINSDYKVCNAVGLCS